MNGYILKKIADARAETTRHLERELRHAWDLQYPVRIEVYRRHLAHLERLAAGGVSEPVRTTDEERARWNLTRCTLDAMAAAGKL